jgi:hypothetical protein|nr:MAG TPA: hypothetical protein [Microviridae sp.]
MGKIFKPQVKFGFLETYSGETIETKVERVTANNEPITDGAEIVYTEKKNGVMPEYNVRTDKWEIAQGAMDRVHANKIAQSKSYANPDKKKDESTAPTAE